MYYLDHKKKDIGTYEVPIMNYYVEKNSPAGTFPSGEFLLPIFKLSELCLNCVGVRPLAGGKGRGAKSRPFPTSITTPIGRKGAGPSSPVRFRPRSLLSVSYHLNWHLSFLCLLH